MKVEIPLEELTRIVDELRCGRAYMLPGQHRALEQLERIVEVARMTEHGRKYPWGKWSSDP